jgi:hypothetical protein
VNLPQRRFWSLATRVRESKAGAFNGTGEACMIGRKRGRVADGASLRSTRCPPISVLDFLDTWVAGGLSLGGLGLGLPQAPQSPCEFVSVGHVWTPPISSSACSVCSFLFSFTSINIFCFQHSGSCHWYGTFKLNSTTPPAETPRRHRSRQ